jgi:hypothetical protein
MTQAFAFAPSSWCLVLEALCINKLSVNGVRVRSDAPHSNPNVEEEEQSLSQPYLTKNKFIFEMHILS